MGFRTGGWSPPENKKQIFSISPLLSVFFGVLSALIFSFTPIAVQMTPKSIGIGELLFYRGLTAVLCISPFVWREIPKLFDKKAALIWIRSIAGALGLYCYFVNTGTGGAAAAKAMVNLSPSFVAIFSFLFFKETITKRQLIGVCISILGVMALVQQNLTGPESLQWYAIGLAGAAFTGVAFMSLRQATQLFSPALIVWTLSILTMSVSAHSLKNNPLQFDKTSWFWLLAVTISSLLGQITLTLSYIALNATVATMLSLITLVMLVIYDFAVSRQIPNSNHLIPYALILSGILVLIRIKRKSPSKT